MCMYSIVCQYESLFKQRISDYVCDRVLRVTALPRALTPAPACLPALNTFQICLSLSQSELGDSSGPQIDMTTEADKEPEKSPVIARLLRNKACHKMPSRVRVNKEGLCPAFHSPACGGRPGAAAARPWHTCRPVSCRRPSTRAAPGHRDIARRPRQLVLVHCWSPRSPRSGRTTAGTGAACCRAACPAAHRRPRARPAASICRPGSPGCAAPPRYPPPRRPTRPWHRLWALQ